MAGMFKVNKTNLGCLGDRDCKALQIDSSAIIKHDCSTQRGDSGTPLIIQPDKHRRQCFLIGIHFGKGVNESG